MSSCVPTRVSHFSFICHSLPHIPLFCAPEFSKPKGSLYGDVIEEIDWSVGQVLDAVRKEGLADNTVVVFLLTMDLG